MGRRLSSHLDLMVPSVSKRVQQSRSQQKVTHDFHASDCEVAEGDRVYAILLPKQEPSGEVVQKTGPLSCQEQLQDGTVWRDITFEIVSLNSQKRLLRLRPYLRKSRGNQL